MHLPRLRSLIVAILFAPHLFADAPLPQTALALIDSYLAQASPAVPAYRTDIRAGGDPKEIPPGRLFAIGPLAGAFTYRPKVYEELTKDERSELLRDPRFRAFLIASRVQADRQTPAGAKSNAGPRPALERIAIPPDEMLRDRPILIVIGNP